MPERIVWDEPSAQLHRADTLAPSPDPQRPGWQDPRVVLATRCGLTIALTGNRENRPAVVTRCPGCFGG